MDCFLLNCWIAYYFWTWGGENVIVNRGYTIVYRDYTIVYRDYAIMWTSGFMDAWLLFQLY